jgi:hypothetical protein
MTFPEGVTVMCCFSRRIDRVSNTNIFARAGKDNKQFLVYAMALSTKDDVAMILPIPTPKASKEDAVRFISLKEYPEFFADMRKGFPAPRSLAKGGAKKDGEKKAEKKLEVVVVGAFEASFVPQVKDFARLDERFRLPASTWDALPAYKDYGFAVFKLKKGETKVHPMAFEFPRADRKRLFFPTVHIHDGKVHKTATFDHALYCQISAGEDVLKWRESPSLAESFVKVSKTAGIVEKNAHVYRRIIRGKQTNQDTWVA